jgi:hypothetical protein
MAWQKGRVPAPCRKPETPPDQVGRRVVAECANRSWLVTVTCAGGRDNLRRKTVARPKLRETEAGLRYFAATRLGLSWSILACRNSDKSKRLSPLLQSLLAANHSGSGEGARCRRLKS